MNCIKPLLAAFALLTVLNCAPAQAQDKNLSWVLYADLARERKEFLVNAMPRVLDLVGNGRGVFALSPELDGDGKQDLVLYFANREECGADGCLYLILYSTKKPISAYTAIDFKITEDGVMLDGKLMGEP